MGVEDGDCMGRRVPLEKASATRRRRRTMLRWYMLIDIKKTTLRMIGESAYLWYLDHV